MADHPMVETARRIADEVLFPRALETDAAGSAPVDMLEVLRDAGMYGIFSPTEVGGSALPLHDRYLVQEALAGACLTTAFVWQQHGGAAAASAATEGPMRELAAPLASGELRAGVAFAHLLRPGPPVLRAEPDGSGWRFTGDAPFVTGWGTIDVVLTAARHDDRIVWALLDARESDGVTSSRLDLAAIDSADTFRVHYDNHHVPAERVTSLESHADWYQGYRRGLRGNGSLPLGVTDRCLRLLGPSHLDDQLIAARHFLDTASIDETAEARGRTGALCVRAAATLVASTGGSALFTTHQAQRLAREALFLLVQGQTPEIKAVHVTQLGG
jgi:alkylation response protein AidB-like acyl-CoA dehydrogenase